MSTASVLAKALAICLAHQTYVSAAPTYKLEQTYMEGYSQCARLVPELQLAVRKIRLKANQAALRRAAAILNGSSAAHINWRQFEKETAADAKKAAEQ